MTCKIVALLTAVLMAALGSQTVVAQEATKEASLKAWSARVGTWEGTDAEGNTYRNVVTKTEAGVFVRRTPWYTILAGWDDELKLIRILGFTSNGRALDHRWKLTDNKGTFKGTTASGEGEFTSVVTGDERTLLFGDTKMVFKKASEKR